MAKRRQNHSCEQCRKAKKACDGYLINSDQAFLAHAALYSEASDGVLACSHCLRTKKTCSLNPHWIQRHPPSTAERLRNPEDSSLDNGQRQVKRQRLQPVHKEGLESAMTSLDSLGQLLQASPQESDGLGSDRLYAPGDSPSITDSNQSGSTKGQQDLENLESLGELSSVASHDNHPADPTLDIAWNGFANPEMTTDCGSDSSNMNAQSVISGFSRGNLVYRSPMSSSTPSQWGDSQNGWRRGDKQQHNNSINMLSLSTFGADYLAMENTNRILISDSLLQIYHDVLENNLACWLAEDTCPYRLQWRRWKRRPEPLPIPENPVPGTQTHPEWGVAWSNRMFHRIRQLDRSAQSAKLIRLTAHENQAASKALNLAVMAFATQWAQGKRRRWDGFRCEDFMDHHEGEELGDEFEQVFQQSIWEQARRELQNVSDLECFRVIFAELVFALVQKPSSSDEYDLDAATIGSATCKSVASSVLPKIADIFLREGPPIFIERAARKIHALKYRFEAYQAGFRHGARSCESEPNAEVPQGMSAEDSQTIGLLYWLAVMLDTVSSSINERPVVVPDEECQHDEAQRVAKGHIERPVTNVRWKLELYAQDDTERPSVLHWPCPYEVATWAVARSAAVKVLLFRHISYLQNGLRNCESGPAIEEIIKATLSVYRYWDITHGAFFRDLTMNYESVPPRIRSWFPCISIPWHLGSLMLANLIDFVDENRLGCDSHRAKRLHVDVAAKIRRASSIELAQFAAVITPQQAVGGGTTMGSKQQQLPGFHFAVNESPALTEPWTILLIRAFTDAAVFHMSEMEELRQNHQWFDMDDTGEALQVSTARAESCIRALRLLGSKSRMAEAIGIVLSKHLDT